MKHFHLGIVAITGLSFWFFLGFPFANRNESYAWIAEFQSANLFSVLTTSLSSIVTFRPIGQVAAWLGYVLSGNSNAIELLNFLLAAFAWVTLLYRTQNKNLLALFALVLGGGFFSGYSYLFHLHGVFYSPLLLLIILLVTDNLETRYGGRVLLLLPVTIFFAFIHPFSLVVSSAYLFGYLLEFYRRQSMQEKLTIVLSIAILVLLGFHIGGESTTILEFDWIPGFLTSYRLIELHPALSIASVFLSGVAVLSVPIAGLPNWAKLVLVAIGAGVLYFAGIPIIILWIIICLVKAIGLRKYSLAFVLMGTFSFPLFAGTGSAAYAIFVLPVCAFVTTIDLDALDLQLSNVTRRISYPLAIVAATAVILIRLGWEVPFVTAFSTPLLAEREKTFQLEKVIRWMTTSDYWGWELRLGQSTGNPVDLENPIDRRFRPPTYQRYLDAYIASLQKADRTVIIQNRSLDVYFGGAKIENAVQVFSLSGKYAGDVTVYSHEIP